jgi:uncharacterized protein
VVFIGGWRPRRRRRYGPYDDADPYGTDPYGSPYGNAPRGYGRYRRGYGVGYGGGGSSCLRDMFLLEGGCCLAELLGCGPQLALLAPRMLYRRPAHLRVPVRSPRPTPTDHVTSAANALLRERTLAALLALIGRYQNEVSAKRRPCCRYTPTCSHYAAQALQAHGLRYGLWLTTKRLARCRPGAAGGLDPIPPGRTSPHIRERRRQSDSPWR